MAEWSIAAVLKTVERQPRSEGSNPSSSATDDDAACEGGVSFARKPVKQPVPLTGTGVQAPLGRGHLHAHLLIAKQHGYTR